MWEGGGYNRKHSSTGGYSHACGLVGGSSTSTAALKEAVAAAKHRQAGMCMCAPAPRRYVDRMLDFIRLNLHPVMYNESVRTGP